MTRPDCWCSVQLHEHVAQRSGPGRQLARDVLLRSICGGPRAVLCPHGQPAVILRSEQVTIHANCWISIQIPGLLYVHDRETRPH